MLDCFPMIRLFLFFFFLTAFPSVFAFAPDSAFGLNPSDIKVNTNPNTPQFRMGPSGDVFIGNGPVRGSAVASRNIGASIGSSNFGVTVARQASASALAKVGRVALRASGWGAVVLLGIDVGTMIWGDEEQDFVIPIQIYPTDWREGIWSCLGYTGYSFHEACDRAVEGRSDAYGWRFSSNVNPNTVLICIERQNGTCMVNAQVTRVGSGCPDGWAVDGMYCVAPMAYRPATDSDIETLVENDIYANDRGGELLDALRRLGYLPDFGPRTIIGPQSIPGDSTTSTTTSPSGTTTTTTTTTHDLTYSPDRIDVKTKETTVVTHPDGTTTTTETVHAPPTGSAGIPAEEQPVFDLCAEYPNISACQELGEPDEDFELDGEEVDVDLDYNSTSGSCPAPRVINTHVGSFSFSWGPFCDYAAGIRPIVILLSLISAFWFVLYVARK